MTSGKKRTIQVSVDIPQAVAQGAGPLVGSYCKRAEELGFAGLWTMDDLLSARPFLDPMGILGYAAAVTEHLTLGVAVLIVSHHNPAVLAKQFTTLDHLSEGRLVVGVGVGHDDESTSGIGFPTKGLGDRSAEVIAILKAFWTEPRASFEGDIWRFSELPMEPKPLRRPHPPIWLGGNRPPALRRAAEVADGWIGAGSSSTAEFAERVKFLTEALTQAGRLSDDFSVAKRVYIAVDESPERAREQVTAYVDTAYGNTGLGDRVSVYGGPERCLDGLHEVIAAGAGHLVLSPVGNYRSQLEALAKVARVLQEEGA
jgi:probable F420-dependent oxidoreductase